VASTAETLHMSIGEVEEKFNHAQLTIISIIQELNHAELKQKMKAGGGRGGRVLNRASTPEQQNANAMKYL